MKNKHWIWICAAVVVILAVLLLWKPFGAKAVQENAPAESASQEPVSQEVPVQSAAPSSEPLSEEPPDDMAEDEEQPGAYILEDEGDLIIVVPEGQESDGF